MLSTIGVMEGQVEVEIMKLIHEIEKKHIHKVTQVEVM